MTISLHAPTPEDAAALLAFELDNRAYFEARINARHADYYHLDAVRQDIAQATANRVNDIAYNYLIKRAGEIVGRVNLTGIARRYYNKAMLGYRVGAAFGGQGIASQAVAQVLDTAFSQFGLWRVEAQVKADNHASIRVLQRNGFREFGRVEQGMYFGGAWHTLLHFECCAPQGPVPAPHTDA